MNFKGHARGAGAAATVGRQSSSCSGKDRDWDSMQQHIACTWQFCGSPQLWQQSLVLAQLCASVAKGSV